MQVGVIATPDVHSFDLTERDHFIILGCDGLWGVSVFFFFRVFLLVMHTTTMLWVPFPGMLFFPYDCRFLGQVMLLILLRSC